MLICENQETKLGRTMAGSRVTKRPTGWITSLGGWSNQPGYSEGGSLSSSVRLALVLTCFLVLLPACGQARTVFSQCGGHLKAPQGIIQSPNFPGPFPVPISCRWVIHVPANSKTVIYFTQYYMRHSFYITEYDHYVGPKDYRNKILVGQIDAEDHLTTVVAYRPFVVLDLVLTDDSNAYLRVEEYLMDVHGLNISYHVVPQDQPLETAPCSVHKCSYLGHCLASAHFSEFSCVCFPGFHGKDCERGPYCDPDKGQNMCLNGGNCRYFYGSLVNACECPAGFDGPMCEEKTSEIPQDECARLQCSHRCDFSHDSEELHCACNKGFKLAEDGTTCVEEEHYRVAASFPVESSGPELAAELRELEAGKDSFTQTATNIFHLSDLSTARDFTFGLISESSVEVVFNLRKEELPSLATALPNLVRDGRLLGVPVDVTKISTQVEPEMKLLNVENADEGPAFEGKLMTLVCSARGSDDLRFQWFKDGRPFNMSLTHRNAWEIRLPETIGEKQISVLNMDGVTTYDRGEFTCLISDFGQHMNQSIVMDVLPYPQVEVTPITVSAIQGSTQTFRCWSLDEIQRKFTYSWLKNGRPLTDADAEIVEDLRPRGSRLLVKSAQISTNYTCCVTNKAGTSKRTGHMFVASANQSALVCPNSALDGVKWNQTFAGFFNLQKCPTDAAGYTSRRCNCDPLSGVCTWGLPNYVRCQSVYLIEIYDMLMNIKLGYQVQPVMAVYHKLFSIARQARHRMFAGDLDITAKNLYMIVTMATDFPDLADEQFSITDLAEFLSILLEEAASLTLEEKQELFVGGRLIQMADSLQVLASKGLLLLQEAQAATVAIELVAKAPVSAKAKEKIFSEASARELYTSTDTPIRSKTRVTRSSSSGNIDGAQNVLVVRYDRSVHPLLDRGHHDRHPEEKFISDVFSFVPVVVRETVERQLYLVDIPHRSEAGDGATKNKTYCLSWEGWTRELPTGEWVSNTCVMVKAGPNMTTCLCPLPGHITAVMVPTNLTVVKMGSNSTQRTLLVTCVVCLACLSLAMVTYLMTARCLFQPKHLIHFNLILSLVGINLVCVICLVSQDNQVVCAGGKILLQFFTVAAFAFLALDAASLFLDIHARTHTRMNFGLPKFLLIGWGFPAVSVICGILAMETSGQDQHCHTWCWWSWSYNHSFTVLVPLVCLVLGHAVFVTMSLIMMCSWKDEWRDTVRRKSIFDIVRSECLVLLLAAFCLLSTKLSHDSRHLTLLVVVILNLLSTLATVVFLVALKKEARMAVLSLCGSAKDSEEKSVFSDLRAPGIPSMPPSHAALEAQKIHDYCETVDRERYTNEHKRQLRTLIRSSSTAGSFSAGAFSAPLGLTTCTPGPRLQASKTCDSGAEAITFNTGNKHRRKLQSNGSGSCLLRPEPSISRLLDSDYSKPVVARSRSIISSGITEEEIPSDRGTVQSPMPVPMVQKSLINRGNATPQSQRDNLVKDNAQQANNRLPTLSETESQRAENHLNPSTGLAASETHLLQDDSQVKTPLVEKHFEVARVENKTKLITSPGPLKSSVEIVQVGKQRECEALLEGEAESERL